MTSPHILYKVIWIWPLVCPYEQKTQKYQITVDLRIWFYFFSGQAIRTPIDLNRKKLKKLDASSKFLGRTGYLTPLDLIYWVHP